MAYVRKTKDVWQLLSNYGYGWECEVEYEDKEEAKADLKSYRENCPDAQYRLVTKRVKL